MRVITDTEAIFAGLATLVILLVMGALIGTASYATACYPALLPVWPAIGMGGAIYGMDRTRGDVRHAWAWVAVVAATLAMLAVLLT